MEADQADAAEVGFKELVVKGAGKFRRAGVLQQFLGDDNIITVADLVRPGSQVYGAAKVIQAIVIGANRDARSLVNPNFQTKRLPGGLIKNDQSTVDLNRAGKG